VKASSTTDWLQAWGTVAGAIFAAAAAIAAFLVLIHEIRIRRRDEDDLRASTARSVLVTAGEAKGTEPKKDVDGLILSLELFVNNFSRFPVVDVWVVAERLNGETILFWSADLLKPGESEVLKCVFHPPLIWPHLAFPPSLFRTIVMFTDDNGLRWQRTDRQQPKRIFTSDPISDRDFMLRKLDQGDDAELRNPDSSSFNATSLGC
jgi:hypothetical protein